MNINLEDYDKLIWHLSHSFKKRWAYINYDVEDLHSEGILVFYGCRNSYDKSLSEFSTFLSKCIINKFFQLIKKEVKTVSFDDDTLELPEIVSHYINFPIMIKNHLTKIGRQTSEFLEMLGSISERKNSLSYNYQICDICKIPRKNIPKIKKEIIENIIL